MSLDAQVRAIRAAARDARDVSTRFGEFAESLVALAAGLEAELEPAEAEELFLAVMRKKQGLLGAVRKLDHAALPLGRKN